MQTSRQKNDCCDDCARRRATIAALSPAAAPPHPFDVVGAGPMLLAGLVGLALALVSAWVFP